MKFPRNLRSRRNSFEIAPFAAVFLLLAMFLMVATLLPVPGIHLQLPLTDNSPGMELPGIDQPTVSVALDANGRCYFASQIVNEAELKLGLAAAVKKSPEPLTLVIQADKTVTYDQLLQLTLLARAAGIQNALLATLPRAVNPPGLQP
jgi:biopolymer transport protein ExbD